MQIKIKSPILMLLMFIFLASCLFSTAHFAGAAVTLEVLNPRGEIVLPHTYVPSPRINTLVGKTIGIYWNGKQGGDNFWDTVQEQLKQKFPGVQIVRYKGPFDLGQSKAESIAKECDVFLYGVGD